MRKHLALLSFIISTAAAIITGCSGRSGSVPINPTQGGEGTVSSDPNVVKLPTERIGARGADRSASKSLPDPDAGSNNGSDPTTPPGQTPTPQPEPATEPAPAPTPAGQVLDSVSTHCSDDLVYWSEASMASVSKLKFHFFNKDRSNFLEYIAWDKGTDAAPLKSYLQQKKAILPAEFTGLADGIYDVLICNQAEDYCDFVYSFSNFTLHNAIIHGEAYGVVGIVHLHIAAGKITSYGNAWFLYPSSTTEVTCTKSS